LNTRSPSFNEDHTPLAYLITFRCYGTWLHGDERGSVDRFHNQYGTPFVQRDGHRERQKQGLLKHTPVALNDSQRKAVEEAILDTCNRRGWLLRAVNVRTNHVHAVVSAPCKPEIICSAFKANGTRQMREDGFWPHSHTPWSDKGSRRYLWTDRHVECAVDYVVNGQGSNLAGFDLQFKEVLRRDKT
jgi:REP element-mobilizing transposase RayT